MNELIITSVKYNLDEEGNKNSMSAVIDDNNVCVPLDPANRHYAEILRQVDEGIITIQDADSN